jgi:hypothetical protein
VTCLCEHGNEPAVLIKSDFLKQLNFTFEGILSMLQLVSVSAIVLLQELQKVLWI